MAAVFKVGDPTVLFKTPFEAFIARWKHVQNKRTITRQFLDSKLTMLNLFYDDSLEEFMHCLNEPRPQLCVQPASSLPTGLYDCTPEYDKLINRFILHMYGNEVIGYHCF